MGTKIMSGDARKDVSIIFFTKDRSKKLKQNISWHDDSSFPIYIVDASEREFEDLDEISAGITYIHMPNASFFERAKKVESVLFTDYYVICADDDFLLPSAIIEITNYLIENRDKNLACAQGRYMLFDRDAFYPKKVYGHCYSMYDSLHIQDDSALRRLLILNSYPIFHFPYAICRKDVIKTFNRIVIDLEKSTKNSIIAHALFEPLMGIAVAISGNYSSVNHPYVVRRPGKPWTNTTSEIFLSDEQYSNLQNILIKNISQLEDFEKLDNGFTCGYLRSVIDSYCNAEKKRLAFKVRKNTSSNSESFFNILKALAIRLFLKIEKPFTRFNIDQSFFDYDREVYKLARLEVFALFRFLKNYKKINS